MRNTKHRLRAKSDFILDSKLQSFLEDRNIKQAAVAHKLSINKSTLHGWLNGCLPRSVLMLSRLADFFEVSMDELCFGRHTVEGKNEPLVLKVSIEVEETKLKLPKLPCADKSRA